ncbi:hypothetical protein BCCR75596_04901 [Burkholderia sola]|nr:hypothetical protein BCCR75597_04901 [Burkholderia cenocepacia]CAG2376580.1 hypothetical protein BCCR75596_04901 [Burkholderia cenocepacia]
MAIELTEKGARAAQAGGCPPTDAPPPRTGIRGNANAGGSDSA